MSEENVEAVRRAYAAFHSGDLDDLLAVIHPEVEFTSLIAEAEGEVFHGHDGVRRWWKEVVLPLGGLQAELEEIRDFGGIVVLRVLGTYSPRGVEVNQTFWHVLRFRDGKAVWWRFVRTDEEALEAAGLSE